MLGKYFDYNATTPLREEVASILVDNLLLFGNPSSSHSFGQLAKEKIEEGRSQVAALINADSSEILFTSGGTESINTALKGFFFACDKRPFHIITSKIEHSATLELCHYLASLGAEITYLPVDANGFIAIEDLVNAIHEHTALISIMYANNEIGTIQPIKEMAKAIKQINRDIFFHVDAVQALGKIPINVQDLEVDALSLAAHKIYGPKGTGALYLKKGNQQLVQLLHGGGQENGLRGGTENLLGIIGFGQACALATEELLQHKHNTVALRNYFLEKIKYAIEQIEMNSPEIEGDVLQNTFNISFTNIRAEALSVLLSQVYGIAVSIGSACSAEKAELSHVLLALGLSEERIKSSIRISFGLYTDYKDIDYLVDSLKEAVTRLRSILPVG
ncbi:cysteine desulfurase family protein [Lysinibacillus parviboronicapiens]|uniref:cysteine desulfurase family protein n=1 Tax=Lysinibacillus parviboronicapiens TaxID=436516 RepID=UPI000D35F807|nr:cysteine desulfurase family protein [Lysinibacillus parviboronicapiens]